MLEIGLFIYKICTIAEWDALQRSRSFAGNTLDQETGFIHLSLSRQLPRIVDKYFPNQDGIIYLKISTEKIKAYLKWEPNSKGDLFPHLYGDLKAEHVTATFQSLEDLLKQDPIEK